MRTTIRLPDALYDRVRSSAADEGVTVTAYIERALQRELTHPRDVSREPFRIEPILGLTLRSGVDLDDNSALLDLMDGLDDEDARVGA